MSVTAEPIKIIVKAPPASADRCALGDACPTRLTCELARQCLPQDGPDPNLKFAWANAICALFVIIGVMGIFQPLFVLPIKASPPKVDTIPVLFNPPPPQPPQSLAQNNAATPENSTAEPIETPEIVPAVTPMNAQITFAVPVEGPVRLVAAKYAEAPPVKLSRPVAPPVSDSKPGGSSGPAVEFNPTPGDGGTYPRPSKYPPLAHERGWQGKAMIEVLVDVRGNPVQVTVAESSGYKILDNDALECVKKRW
ncbi:MAG: energy transducer TonB, partial [Verrucomicrobia bacterium]|nr:energy transducer TonB [Verrucomicrobiota bacterium]